MKTLLIVCGLFLHGLCIGQIKRTETTEFIKIGEFKSGPLNAALKYAVADSDTTYHLLFQNAQYRTITDIKSFAFRNEHSTIDTLYNLLEGALRMKKGKKINFHLGDDEIVVASEATMGIRFINVLRPSDGALLTLTHKQLKKLFDR